MPKPTRIQTNECNGSPEALAYGEPTEGATCVFDITAATHLAEIPSKRGHLPIARWQQSGLESSRP